MYANPESSIIVLCAYTIMENKSRADNYKLSYLPHGPSIAPFNYPLPLSSSLPLSATPPPIIFPFPISPPSRYPLSSPLIIFLFFSVNIHASLFSRLPTTPPLLSFNRPPLPSDPLPSIPASSSPPLLLLPPPPPHPLPEAILPGLQKIFFGNW